GGFVRFATLAEPPLRSRAAAPGRGASRRWGIVAVGEDRSGRRRRAAMGFRLGVRCARGTGREGRARSPKHRNEAAPQPPTVPVGQVSTCLPIPAGLDLPYGSPIGSPP